MLLLESLRKQCDHPAVAHAALDRDVVPGGGGAHHHQPAPGGGGVDVQIHDVVVLGVEPVLFICERVRLS